MTSGTGFPAPAGSRKPTPGTLSMILVEQLPSPRVASQAPTDALDDPNFRIQMQGLKDMTAAIDGKESSTVVFSIDQGSVLKKKQNKEERNGREGS